MTDTGKKHALDSSDPLERARAARELPAEEQETLQRLASSDADARVRQVAVRRLKDTGAVLGILKSDDDAHVRTEARERLLKACVSGEPTDRFEELAAVFSDEELSKIAKEAPAGQAGAAIPHLRAERFLVDIAKSGRTSELRLAALARVDGDDALADVAVHAASKDVGLAATGRVVGEPALTRIAERARLKPVMKAALSRLGREEEAAKLSSVSPIRIAPEPEPAAEARPALDPEAEARAIAEFDRKIAARKTILARFETVHTENAKDAVAAARADWAALEPLDGVQAAELDARFRSTCDKALDAVSRAERLAAAASSLESLAARAESLAAEGVIRDHRARTRALRHDWDHTAQGVGLPDDDPRRARFEAAVLKVEQALAEIDAADKVKRDEELEELRTLPGRLRVLLDQKDPTIGQLEQAQRELRSMEPLVGMLEGDERKAIGRALEELRPKIFARSQEVREATEWTGFANLAAQERLIGEIEAAAAIENPDAAANRLRAIEASWAEVRRVPKAEGEELWKKYVSFRDPLRRRLNEFFAKRTSDQKDSKKKKEELIARAEALAAGTDWKKGADDFKALQNEWRALPSAGKAEKDLIPRFKAPADRFFAARKAALDERDKEFSANREKFEALVAQAEALAVSTDWSRTTGEAKKLQADWKTVGSIPMKQREALYGRFHKAIDAVFDRYRRRDSIENEKASAEREAVLAELESFAAAEPADDFSTKAADIRVRWRKLDGRPARDHDARYRAAFASLVAKKPDAFRGTDLDPAESRKKLEKLIERLAELEAKKAKADSMDLAAKLKEAWAARTMGAKAGDSNYRAEVEKARSAYEKLGPITGDGADELRGRFEEACRKLA